MAYYNVVKGFLLRNDRRYTIILVGSVTYTSYRVYLSLLGKDNLCHG